jgi:hypothetical protein
MAINAVPSSAPIIDEVLLDAFKKAGLLAIEYGIGSDVQWGAKAAHGRRTLNRLLASYSTVRFFEYFVNLDVLDITAGTSLYTLDADILNIVDDGSYVSGIHDRGDEATTGETPVKPMSGFRWNQLSSKASEGRPVHYFIERNQSQLVMRLWPVPSETGQIRFRTHRIPGSSSTGSNNPDFMRHWEQWAVYALAYEFMTDGSMPLDERKLMRADRDVAFELLKSYDTNNTPPEVLFVHSTPWSTGRRQ